MHHRPRRLPPLPVVPQAVPVLRLRGRGRRAAARALPRRDPRRAGAPRARVRRASWSRSISAAARRRCGGRTASPRAIARDPRALRRGTAASRSRSRPTRPTAPTRTSPRGARPGITRVSIGVQSLDARGARRARPRSPVRRRARPRSSATLAAGFTTSADFILGTPPRGRRERSTEIAARADHLSVYELTIEDRTAFGQRVRDGRLVPLDEDALTDLYLATHDALTAARLRALRDQLVRAARASARSTTACTGAARRSSGSASARPRSSCAPTAAACARPTRAGRPTTSRRPVTPAERAHDRRGRDGRRPGLARAAHLRRGRRGGSRAGARGRRLARRGRARRAPRRPDLPDPARLSDGGSDRRAHRATLDGIGGKLDRTGA